MFYCILRHCSKSACSLLYNPGKAGESSCNIYIVGHHPLGADSLGFTLRRRRTLMKIANFSKMTGGKRQEGRVSEKIKWLSLMLAILLLSACYPAPYRPIPRSIPRETASTQPAPATQVYFYPKAGQSNEQQSRDHYECYNWAIKQTGFDPGQSTIPKDERVRVVPMPPPGYDTATFAVAGAVLGALLGGRHNALGGAVIGASGGAIVGAVSDANRQETARQLEESYNTRDQARNAQLEEKASGFRRAMSACLEGRGYSVK
jgi:hypothetical protein